MIRTIDNKDIHKIMEIWLKSTIKAHDFIPKEYWEASFDLVKDTYILIICCKGRKLKQVWRKIYYSSY